MASATRAERACIVLCTPVYRTHRALRGLPLRADGSRYLARRFLRSGAERGDYNFFWTRGYPYVLGAIYAVAGVHPAAVYRIRLCSGSW